MGIGKAARGFDTGRSSRTPVAIARSSRRTGHMSESGRVSEFSAVDRAPDPTFAIRFMETARTQPGFRACKAKVLRALGLTAGSAAADVGCGLGTDAAEMAVLVAPGGTVHGIDGSEAMITAARERHAHPG